jgi:hypothetical protein
MSTAGGAAALTIDILTNLAGLGGGLAQAEAQVNQTAQNMGKKMDAATGRFGSGIVQGLKTLGTAAAVADVVGNLAERMTKEFGARIDLDEVIIGTMRDAVGMIPVLGPATLKAADLFKPYGEEAGISFVEGFYTMLQDSLFGAGKGPIKFAERFHAGTGVGIMESLSEMMDAVMYGTRFRLPTPGVPIGPNENLVSGLRDEFAELMGRQQVRQQQDQRSQMIAQRTQLAYGQVDTAFGTMKFAAGDPAAASREIIKKADEQLWEQRRLNAIVETLGRGIVGGN